MNRASGDKTIVHISFPIVALGSSAGGLEAIKTFFKKCSLRFWTWRYVFISHLEPHHPSLLAEIISKSTTMEAVQAEDDMVVKNEQDLCRSPGQVYDNHRWDTSSLLTAITRTSLSCPSIISFGPWPRTGKRTPSRVILSGNVRTGPLGIKAIHSNLGMIMVQSPETAKYDSMPRNAIETGLVDYVLPPNEMPEMIDKIFSCFGTKGRPPKVEPVGAVADAEHKILSIVKKWDRSRFLALQEKHRQPKDRAPMTRPSAR